MRISAESSCVHCSRIVSYLTSIMLSCLGFRLSALSMIDVRNYSRFDSRIYLPEVCLNNVICSFLMLARTFSMFVLRSSMLDSLRETGV